MTKIDDIRCFAEDIAQWRVGGLTWAQIAAKLGEEDIHVGTDEIRSYWPRLADGRSPEEYLLYWRRTQLHEELRESRKRGEAAEAEIEDLRKQLLDWRQQHETLQAECDRLHEVASQQDRSVAESRESFHQQVADVTKLAAAWQREASEANNRLLDGSVKVQALRQQVSDLEQQLVEAEARTVKLASENEVYGNIRYFMGKSEMQTQLDEANKALSGWVRFGESLSQAHLAGNKAEIAQLLERVAAWATSRGKA